MGTLTSFIGAAVAVQSRELHRPLKLLCQGSSHHRPHHQPPSLIAGMWTGSLEAPLSRRWISQMMSEHPGAVIFLGVDVLILSGAAALTIAQSSQVAEP